jgi:hypothetical protein
MLKAIRIAEGLGTCNAVNSFKVRKLSNPPKLKVALVYRMRPYAVPLLQKTATGIIHGL